MGRRREGNAADRGQPGRWNGLCQWSSRPDPRFPFSGHKESGIGAEYGLMGLIEYCQVKSVVKHRASS